MSEAESRIGDYMQVREGIEKRAIGEQAARVIGELMKCSYLVGRADAPIARLDDLAAAAFIHRGNLRRVLDQMVRADVLDEQQHGTWYVFVIRPDWKGWALPMRRHLEEEIEGERARKRLRTAAENDPSQLTLLPTEADLTTEVSQAFAEFAVTPRATETADSAPVARGNSSGQVVPGTTIRHRTVVPGTTSETARGEVVPGTTVDFTDARALRASARAPEHDHEHVPTTVPKHVHDHGVVPGTTAPSRPRGHEHAPLASEKKPLSLRELEALLTADQLTLLDQVQEAGDDPLGKFRKTWAGRLVDGGLTAEKALRGAIGETRHRKQRGEKFRKGPGECLNDIFHRLRDAARKAACA